MSHITDFTGTKTINRDILAIIGNKASDNRHSVRNRQVYVVSDSSEKFRGFNNDRYVIPDASLKPQIIPQYQDETQRGLDKIYDSLRMRINQFKELPENWDSYGSGPASALAANNALEFLEKLYMEGIIPSSVSSGDESIIIKIKENDYSFMLDFYFDGEIIFVHRNNRDYVEVSEINNEEYNRIIDQIVDILYR